MLSCCGACRLPLESCEACFLAIRAMARQAGSATRSLLQDGHARHVATPAPPRPSLPACILPCRASAAAPCTSPVVTPALEQLES